MSELNESVKKSLRASVLGVGFVEAKKRESVEAWWNGLPGKKRGRLCEILGLDKGKSRVLYGKLRAAEQDEVASYFRKHGGIVESSSGDVVAEVDFRMDGRVDLSDLLTKEQERLVSDVLAQLKRKPVAVAGFVVDLLDRAVMKKESEAMNRILLSQSRVERDLSVIRAGQR